MVNSMRRDEPQIALLAIFAVVVGLPVFFAVKAFGDMLHLSWGAAGSLLLGFITLVSAVCLVLIRGFNLRKLFPWMLCGFYLFTIPAWRYWSLDMPSRLFIEIDENAGVERLWYGQGWCLLLIFIGLVGCAYGWNRLQDDHYW